MVCLYLNSGKWQKAETNKPIRKRRNHSKIKREALSCWVLLYLIVCTERNSPSMLFICKLSGLSPDKQSVQQKNHSKLEYFCMCIHRNRISQHVGPLACGVQAASSLG